MPTCPICRAQLAVSKTGYDTHIKRYHSKVTPVLHVSNIPVNTSGRTKADIVADVENRLAAHIVGGKLHDNDCTCNGCFQRRLDALVKSSEEAAHALQSDSALGIDDSI